MYEQLDRDSLPSQTKLSRHAGRLLVPTLFLMLLIAACVAYDGFDQYQTDPIVPPDTMVAVSAAYVIESVNSAAQQIRDKSGNYVTNMAIPLGHCMYAGADDLRIRYDKISGRWFGAAFNTSEWCLSVSTTGMPNGTYYQYSFPATPDSQTTCNPDFPSIGFSTDKVLLGGGRCFVVISKAAILAGANPLPSQYFASGSAQVNQHPFAAYSLSTYQHDAFVASFDFTVNPLQRIRVWRIRGVPGQGSGASAVFADVVVPGPLPPPVDAVQRGTSTQIAMYFVGTRVLDAVFKDGLLWTASNSGCVPPGDSSRRTCATVLRIRDLEVDPFQPHMEGEYQFAANAGSYTYFPAITIDAAGNLITVFNRSSASEYISVYGSGVHGNTLLATSQVAIWHSSGPYNQSRFGDISGAAIDPADETTAWVAAEYVKDVTHFGTLVSQASKAICGAQCP